MKPEPFFRAFSFFFLQHEKQTDLFRNLKFHDWLVPADHQTAFFFTKIRREVDKSLRKLGDIKADTHNQRLERRLQENGLAWGVESYVTS